MPPVPLLRLQQVIRAFEKLGWEVARQPYHPDETRSYRIALYPEPFPGCARDIAECDRQGGIDGQGIHRITEFLNGSMDFPIEGRRDGSTRSFSPPAQIAD